jgi:hypothetical protein
MSNLSPTRRSDQFNCHSFGTCSIRGSGYNLLHTREDTERGSMLPIPTKTTTLPSIKFRSEVEQSSPCHSQPAAQTSSQCPRPTYIQRDSGAPPRSASSGPVKDPHTACPPSPTRPGEPASASPDNLACTESQTRTHMGGGVSPS